MEELQQQSTASYVSLSEMAIPLSLSSLSQSTSFLSSFDVALFCIVLIVTLSLGVLHTCLITKRINGPRTEKSNENEYDPAQTRSHRGSDTSNPSTRNSNLDMNGDEREGNGDIETNGGIEGKHRDSKHDTTISSGGFRSGLAIIPNSDGVSNSSAGTCVDLMFQLICFASVILTMGLPMYSYLHGPSLALSIFPAMLAAHVTSIFIVIPFVKRFRRKQLKYLSSKQKKGRKHEENDIFLVNYLLERYGGIDNTTSHQDVKRTEISHRVSSTNASYRIFLILIWTLIFILWGFVTVRMIVISGEFDLITYNSYLFKHELKNI